MAIVMPGTVIRFGAEYHRRPFLSLFSGGKNRGNVTATGTKIRLQAAIAITRENSISEDNIIFLEEPEEQQPAEQRGLLVDIIA